MEFILNYGGTILISFLLATAVFFAVRKIVKNKKDGKSCSCDCNGCAFKDNCNK